MEFARVFTGYLDREGYSYSDIHRMIGRSRSWVGRIASGAQLPTNADTIRQLASAVGAPADEFFIAAGRVPDDVHDWITTDTRALPAIRKMMEDQ